MVLALTLLRLEIVPLAVGMPGLAITTIGLAILARDGVLMLLALGRSQAAFGLVGAALRV